MRVATPPEANRRNKVPTYPVFLRRVRRLPHSAALQARKEEGILVGHATVVQNLGPSMFL